MVLLAEGKLGVVVDQVFPMAEAVAAHRYIESGKAIGKVVLAI
jgi:NADPH:quinone reductase-like Zn-dependent oxidoreductase